MPIIRKLVAPDCNEENQWLKVDSSKRYIVNDTNDWQFLFGPGSSFTTSTQIAKIAAEFDTTTFNNIRLAAYLYNPASGTVSNSASCTFNIYRVTTPAWTDTLITSVAGVQQYNNYYYKSLTLADLSPSILDGDTTLMIEVVITRLTETYRDRIYVNHLGVYGSIVQLRQAVDFLDITKLDE